MNFNILDVQLYCPFCNKVIESGVGFQVGSIENRKYRIGEKLIWGGNKCRPEQRPLNGSLQTIGYFNCDNIKCSSWNDCYPEIQMVLIEIKHDFIINASVYSSNDGMLIKEQFPILNCE